GMSRESCPPHPSRRGTSSSWSAWGDHMCQERVAPSTCGRRSSKLEKVDPGRRGHRRETTARRFRGQADRHHSVPVPDERVTLLPQWECGRQPGQLQLHVQEGVLLPPDEEDGLVLEMASGPDREIALSVERLADDQRLVEQLAPGLQGPVLHDELTERQPCA